MWRERNLLRGVAYTSTVLFCCVLGFLLAIPMFVFFVLGTLMVFSDERWRRMVASGVCLSFNLYIVWGVLSYWNQGRSFFHEPGTLSRFAGNTMETLGRAKTSPWLDAPGLLCSIGAGALWIYLLWFDGQELRREQARKILERTERLEALNKPFEHPSDFIAKPTRADEMDASLGWDEVKTKPPANKQ